MRIRKFRLGQELDLKIDSLSYNGGRGVGRHEGMVVFVPWTAPGDDIRAVIVEVKPSFLVAQVKHWIRRSPFRRDPQCPVFSKCGGCVWQHVTYDEQLRQKQRILESSLKRLSGFEWLPIVPSPDEYGYRNRIQVRKRGDAIGFLERGTSEIASTKACPIAEQEISAQIPSLSGQPDGRYEISRRKDGRVVAEAGQRDPEASLFSQVNTKQNENLIRAALEWVRPLQPKHIWDLYCGSGNFSFPFAIGFPETSIDAVELSREAIALAEKQTSRIRWFAQDCVRFLKSRQNTPNLLVVLDPPRVGVDAAVIRELGRLKPRNLLYVSCNPMTFARDAERLREEGFALRQVQGFDMFPQTEHVELLALLHGVIEP